MAHELEPRESSDPGALAPMYGPSGGFPVANPGSYLDKPVWLEAGTPKTPGTNFFARADQVWFYIAYPIRSICLAILMLTYRWYYVVGVGISLWFVLYLLTSTPEG